MGAVFLSFGPIQATDQETDLNSEEKGSKQAEEQQDPSASAPGGFEGDALKIILSAANYDPESFESQQRDILNNASAELRREGLKFLPGVSTQVSSYGLKQSFTADEDSGELQVLPFGDKERLRFCVRGDIQTWEGELSLFEGKKTLCGVFEKKKEGEPFLLYLEEDVSTTPEASARN